MSIDALWELLGELNGSMAALTRVGASELLELLGLEGRAGALDGHGGHLRGGGAKRRGHCDDM